jgi:hypothetical protein
LTYVEIIKYVDISSERRMKERRLKALLQKNFVMIRDLKSIPL